MMDRVAISGLCGPAPILVTKPSDHERLGQTSCWGRLITYAYILPDTDARINVTEVPARSGDAVAIGAAPLRVVRQRNYRRTTGSRSTAQP